MNVDIFYVVNVQKLNVEKVEAKEVISELEAFLSAVSIVAKTRGFDVLVDSTIVLHSKPEELDLSDPEGG